MASETITSSEYIKHHLQNLTFGQRPDGTWGVAQSAEEAADMGFWAINLDTIGVSLLLGVIMMWFFRSVAKKPVRVFRQVHRTLQNGSWSLSMTMCEVPSAARIR